MTNVEQNRRECSQRALFIPKLSSQRSLPEVFMPRARVILAGFLDHVCKALWHNKPSSEGIRRKALVATRESLEATQCRWEDQVANSNCRTCRA